MRVPRLASRSRTVNWSDMSGTPLRVDWVLSGDRTKASSRLQGFLIHEWMERQGVASRIVATDFNRIDSSYSLRFLEVAAAILRHDATHVIFEAPEWLMVILARLCSLRGKRVVAVRCDRIHEQYDEYFDATIVPTEGLRRALGISRGIVIEDACEVPPETYKRDYRGDGKLRVVWVGHGGYREYILDIVKRLRSVPDIERSFAFELISSGGFATKQWSEGRVLQDVLACDLAIIPLPAGEWYVNKSSNRLIMMLALGMPVLASLIPSYRELAQEGVNGLFVESDEEFATRLPRLRSEELRASLGRAGRLGLGDRFGIDKVGPQWLAGIESVSMANPGRLRTNSKLRMFGLLVRLVGACRRPASGERPS